MCSVTPIRYHKRSALSNSAFYLVFKVRKIGLEERILLAGAVTGRHSDPTSRTIPDSPLGHI